MKIGESLKRFRNEFRLTQKEVARRVSIVPQQWQKYEYDQMSPSAELIAKIAVAYNVSADYLLGLSDLSHPPDVSTLVAAINDAKEILGNALERRAE